MTRLEQLQAELAQISIRQKEIQNEIRIIKADQRNEYRRQIRALLNERGFTLKDAIEGHAGIDDLSQATWYTSAFTPFGEDGIMVYSRDFSTRTTSLENANQIDSEKKRFGEFRIFALYPSGNGGWRQIHPNDYRKIRGLKK